MRDLKGKTAFVTGGASGFGLEFAKVFLEQGMNVALADIEEAALAKRGGGSAAPTKIACAASSATSPTAPRCKRRRMAPSPPSGACISSATTPGSAAGRAASRN